MTFDSHSIERLKELGRKLPKQISKPQSLETNNQRESKPQNLHPVEIETNPEQLFRELMKISPDGNIPAHLMDRLKQVESNTIKTSLNTDDLINEASEETLSDEALDLYSHFKQLLLEDDEN